MQLDNREHGAGPAPVAFALLLSFTRHLVRYQCGQDVLILSLMAAQKEQGASESEIASLVEAVKREHATHNVWPKGF